MGNIAFYLGNVGESILDLNIIAGGVIWILWDIKTHKCMYMCTCVIVHLHGHVDSPFQKSLFHTPLNVNMSAWSLLFPQSLFSFERAHMSASSKLIWSSFCETQLKLGWED